MFKLYSKGCQYALRVLAFVLVEQSGSRISARDLCERLDIPESFSRKVLQLLVQGGLLEASRGPGGGYSLTRNPEEITLLDVIHAVDGDDCYDQCILGLDTCRPETPCPLHDFWSAARKLLLQQLQDCTLADIGAAPLEHEIHKILPQVSLPNGKKSRPKAAKAPVK
jgi:Rrf2 family protein